MRLYFLLVCPAVLALALPLPRPSALNTVRGTQASVVRISEPNTPSHGVVRKRSAPLPPDGHPRLTETSVRNRVDLILQQLDLAIAKLGMLEQNNYKKDRPSKYQPVSTVTDPSSPPSEMEMRQTIAALRKFLDETIEDLTTFDQVRKQTAALGNSKSMKESTPNLPEPRIDPVLGTSMLRQYLDDALGGLAKLEENKNNPPEPANALPANPSASVDEPKMDIVEQTAKIREALDEAIEHSKNLPKSSEPHPILLRAYQLAPMGTTLPHFLSEDIIRVWSKMSAGQLQQVTQCYAKKSFKMRKSISLTNLWLRDCTRRVYTQTQASGASNKSPNEQVTTKQETVSKPSPKQQGGVQAQQPIDKSPPPNGQGTPSDEEGTGGVPARGNGGQGFSEQQAKKKKQKSRQKKKPQRDNFLSTNVVPTLSKIRQNPGAALSSVANDIRNALPTNRLPGLNGGWPNIFAGLAAPRPAIRPGLVVP